MIALLFPLASPASVVGDFSQIRHLPGYIETDPNSEFYQGAASKKQFMDGIERRSPSEILVSLFSGETLDAGKVQVYIDRAMDYLNAAYAIECHNENGTADAGVCDKDVEFQDKWTKNPHNVALNLIRDQLSIALQKQGSLYLSEINHPKNADAVEKLFSAIDLWESVKAEDEQRARLSPTVRAIVGAAALIEKNYINNERTEASNLLVPKGHPLYGKQLFFSEKNLEELKSQGYDLSLLNPPSSPMWRQPKKSIRLYDTTNYDNEGMLQIRKLYSEREAKAIVDPNQEISVVYKPHKLTGGATPKFDVTYGKVKWKLKFLTDRKNTAGTKSVVTEFMKLIMGSEANVEPVANNLAAALGYTVDPTYFKKKIRVYFDDKVYETGAFDKALSEMMRALDARYPATVNTRAALSAVKTDEGGRKYIELKSVSLEQKSNPETDLNVGFFDHIGMGRDLAREHRAFLFYLAWVGDPDIKNDNDKTKVVPTSTGYKVVHSNSDLGASFGIGFPNIYNYPLIKQVFRDNQGNVEALRLNFHRIFQYPMKDVVTLNDAKWFARLMGQLTYEQLEKSFVAAGYPTVIARYYALLAAKKRNELITALDLMGTSFINDQGETVKLEPLPEFTGTIPGYEEFFVNGMLTDPENKIRDPELENWDRHWGTKISLFSQDPELNKKVRVALKNTIVSIALKTMHTTFLDRTVINKKNGLSFEDARIVDHDLGKQCQGDCFVQALDYGVRNFMPMRFMIDNPNVFEDPDHPLWIVDLMRIGGFVGDRGELLQKLIGFDAPSSTRTALGSRVFKIFEIVKVTPIRGIDEFFANPKNFTEMPRYALPGLRDQLISELSDNGSLIVSSYLGLETQGRIKIAAFPFSIPAIRAGVNIMKASRVTIHKKGGEFQVNWDKENTSNGSVGLNLIDVLFKIPLVNQQWVALSKKERTFIFRDNSTERDVLVRHLGKSTNDEELEPYRWEYKKESVQSRQFKAGIPLWRSYRRSFSKSTTEYENYRDQVESKYRKVELEVERTRVSGVDNAVFTKSAEVLVHENGEVAASVKTRLDYPSATKEGIIQLFEWERSYFPESFFYFDMEQLKNYMGDVTAESNFILKQSMLEKVFSESWTFESICEAFPDTGCTNKFFRLYSQARKHFQRIYDKGYDAKTRALKKVVRFFINHNEQDFMGFVKAALGKKGLIESADMTSSLAAFPGDNDSIAVKSSDKELKSASKFFIEPILFSDKIHQALSTVFFVPSNL